MVSNNYASRDRVWTLHVGSEAKRGSGEVGAREAKVRSRKAAVGSRAKVRVSRKCEPEEAETPQWRKTEIRNCREMETGSSKFETRKVGGGSTLRSLWINPHDEIA